MGEVAVAGVPQEDGNFLVVAFVVKKDGYNVTEKDIYDHVESNYSFKIFFSNILINVYII